MEEGSLPEQIFSVGENSRHEHLKGPESVRKLCQRQVSRLLDRTAVLLGGSVASYKVLYALAHQESGP